MDEAMKDNSNFLQMVHDLKSMERALYAHDVNVAELYDQAAIPSDTALLPLRQIMERKFNLLKQVSAPSGKDLPKLGLNQVAPAAVRIQAAPPEPTQQPSPESQMTSNGGTPLLNQFNKITDPQDRALFIKANYDGLKEERRALQWKESQQAKTDATDTWKRNHKVIAQLEELTGTARTVFYRQHRDELRAAFREQPHQL